MPESPAQAVTRLRKAGELKDAWDMAEDAIRKTPDDLYLKQAVFWVCYAFLKNIQEIYLQHQLEQHKQCQQKQLQIGLTLTCFNLYKVNWQVQTWTKQTLVCGED